MKVNRVIILLAVAMLATATFAQSYELSRAKYFIESGDYKQAAITLRPLAENGNAEAQYLASKLFAEGKGVVKSVQQAERYLLLSAQNGYAQAMEECGDAAFLKEDYPTAYEWMKAANDKEYTSYRAFFVGYMTYFGNGVQADKKEGWELMYANMASETSRSNIIVELHTDFYRYIVDSNLGNPENLKVSLETTYAEKYGKAEWVDEVTDYLLEKLATLPEQQQNEHLKVWQTKYGSYLSVYIYAMMIEKGIGTKKSLVTAYYYASQLYNCDLKQFPSIKKGVESIVYSYSESHNEKDDTGEEIIRHDVLDVNAEYPGGIQALSKFISNNMNYPLIAKEQGIQGKVLTEFVINKDGTPSEFKVLQSPDPSFSNEALRLLKLMPIWIPAQLGGKPVRVRYRMPFSFRLQ